MQSDVLVIDIVDGSVAHVDAVLAHFHVAVTDGDVFAFPSGSFAVAVDGVAGDADVFHFVELGAVGVG